MGNCFSVKSDLPVPVPKSPKGKHLKRHESVISDMDVGTTLPETNSALQVDLVTLFLGHDEGHHLLTLELTGITSLRELDITDYVPAEWGSRGICFGQLSVAGGGVNDLWEFVCQNRDRVKDFDVIEFSQSLADSLMIQTFDQKLKELKILTNQSYDWAYYDFTSLTCCGQVVDKHGFCGQCGRPTLHSYLTGMMEMGEMA